MKILLTIAYDGSAYNGWQTQPNKQTVQGCLERALATLYKTPIHTLGAGRTDAGVHAEGQRASFVVPESSVVIPLENLPLALRALLPDDIVVTSAEEVPSDFSPIANAKQKTYEYTILNQPYPNPKLMKYACHISTPLDFAAMQQAAAAFEGTHDFAAFCSTGSSATSTVRTIYECRLEKDGSALKIYITGNGFLYNMVRIIVGTLIDVGFSKKAAGDIPQILKSLDRTKAGKTAPSQGLTLISVEY